MTDFTYLILVKGLLLILTQKKKKKGLAFNALCVVLMNCFVYQKPKYVFVLN